MIVATRHRAVAIAACAGLAMGTDIETTPDPPF
jgi:hypothetical protein